MPRSREPPLIQHDWLPINLHLLRVFVALGNYALVQLYANKWHQKAWLKFPVIIQHLIIWPDRFSPGAKLIHIRLKPESSAILRGDVVGECDLRARTSSEVWLTI